MMPGMPERRTHDYVRRGVTNLFAAFNIADETVISSIHRRHRAIEFKKFLAKIDDEVPGDLEVHLVCDNYGTHKTPAINAWLAKHPRFHMHNTATSSSWINQSNAGSASSPTSSSAEAATPPPRLSKPTSAPGPRDGTKTPNRSSGPNPPNRSSSQSGDFLYGSPVRHTSPGFSKSIEVRLSMRAIVYSQTGGPD